MADDDTILPISGQLLASSKLGGVGPGTVSAVRGGGMRTTKGSSPSFFEVTESPLLCKSELLLPFRVGLEVDSCLPLLDALEGIAVFEGEILEGGFEVDGGKDARGCCVKVAAARCAICSFLAAHTLVGAAGLGDTVTDSAGPEDSSFPWPSGGVAGRVSMVDEVGVTFWPATFGLEVGGWMSTSSTAVAVDVFGRGRRAADPVDPPALFARSA